MLGSVEEHVADGASVLDRVFVPIDYSMGSHRALGVALELMEAHGAAVRVFHAAEGTAADDWLGGSATPAVGGDGVAIAEERLRRFLENVAPAFAARVEVSAKVGDPRATLPRAAREWNATLVVAPADVHALLLRSPAERLVRGAEIPVLVIPA